MADLLGNYSQTAPDSVDSRFSGNYAGVRPAATTEQPKRNTGISDVFQDYGRQQQRDLQNQVSRTLATVNRQQNTTPQRFDVPSMHKGGRVAKTGLYRLEKGERVTPNRGKKSRSRGR